MDLLNVNEFKKAKDGSVFIKKGDKLIAYDPKNFKTDISKLESKAVELDTKIADMVKYTTHFQKYALSHFIVVFTAFKTKVMCGEVDVEDYEIMNLDEKVIKGELSVQEAIEKHPYLKETFETLFVNSKDEIMFPQI